ncbi:hypothetical protein CEP51_015940 [Fusarium floridanum]|uniref:PD-(D/E)XK nuclease-like domain-containing protein n=1 Tax=Fusarium floridanum TaxID=1325733 RepID=A0A428P000_9HYPO|nr:hypothetical protein CEP51_015940 [Fusarium floridanum]
MNAFERAWLDDFIHHWRDDIPFDNDKTPNALAQARTISLHSLPRPDLGQTPTRSSTKASLYQSPSRTSTSRSGSPVKCSTLELLKKPVRYVAIAVDPTEQLPDDVISLFDDITSINLHKEKFLPGSLRSELEALHRKGTIRPGWYFDVDDDDEAKKTQHKSELIALDDIREAAITCHIEEAAEAAWNLEVHAPLLKLALQPFPSLRRDLLTAARISTPFLPEMKVKPPYDFTCAQMVDLGVRVCLPPHLTEIVEQAIIRLPEEESCVNQTTYEPVRNDPIAMVIGSAWRSSEAREQLGIWVASWHQRMNMLIGTSSTKPLVTLPLIIVMEHEWRLLFACDRQDRIEILKGMDIGSTNSIIGLYTILASLRVIGKWMQDTYLVWFEEMFTKLG